MPILILLAVLAVLALVFGPSLWVRRVLSRYSQPGDRYPGAGGAFARHLLDELGLQQVKVEISDGGDHYDPAEKAVRLTRDKHDGRSLTAITVAAHEVGHAMQDRDDYGPLRVRTALAARAAWAEKLGAAILFSAPVIMVLTRAPSAGLLMLIGGLLTLGTTTVMHLLTLPTELDASFRRALPILQQGGYLIDGDLPHARRLLRAAALTYVAGSMISLLSVGRWLTILRR